jgi:hypothetical protein
VSVDSLFSVFCLVVDFAKAIALIIYYYYLQTEDFVQPQYRQ